MFESAETKLKPLSITNNPRNLDAFVRLIAFMSQVCICPAARCGGGVPVWGRCASVGAVCHAGGGAGALQPAAQAVERCERRQTVGAKRVQHLLLWLG